MIDRFKRGIIICLSCQYADIVKTPIQECPECFMMALATWDSIEKFKLYVKNCKPTNIKIRNKELLQIYNSTMI
ncbi:hypothetical protein D3C71_948660 [compost metagenome]